ncbi:MAG TPA: class I SAM-dependent methyltransferase [Gaiellaceae bacterium]|nr:class I SAM-dependent methyltransferase [Gaiellaceae bacterium]
MSAPSREVIKDYNERDYRTVWAHGARSDFEDHFETALLERLLSSDPGWLIDLGAGYGRLYPIYAKPDRAIVMVDYAVNLLEIAAETYRDQPGVHFVAANAYHLPFRPATFSVGLSNRTFHHMAHPELFLDELARVMRAQSHVALEYSNKRNALRVMRYGRRSLREDHEHYGQLLYGTHPRLFARLAESAGFEVGDRYGTGFFSRFLFERTKRAFRPLAAAETVADASLGRLDLAPMHFVDLRRQNGVEPAPPAPPGPLADILQCPACAGDLEGTDSGLACRSCELEFPRIGPVLDLRYVGELG